MLTISPRHTLSEATTLFGSGPDPVLVVDGDGRYLGLIGDAELRAAAFRATPSGAGVREVMNVAGSTVQVGFTAAQVIELFERDVVEHVVELLPDGRPSAVHLRGAHLPNESRLDTAILMVGGEGRRLRPLTENTPKPLLPIAGVPILERIVRRLEAHGVRRVVMALGYRAEQIEGHFGDGADFGLAVEYVREETPLGTAGAIALVRDLGTEPLLVMNGDILTELDFSRMALAHRRESAAVTVAARPYHHRVPYGVFKLFGDRVVAVEEKPTQTLWTNAGVYLMEPGVVDSMPRNTYLDMTVVMETLIGRGERVTAFPVREYWCDIGLPEDYARAEEAWSRRQEGRN